MRQDATFQVNPDPSSVTGSNEESLMKMLNRNVVCCVGCEWIFLLHFDAVIRYL